MNKDKICYITVIYNHYEILGRFLKENRYQLEGIKIYVADLSDNKQTIKSNLDLEIMPSINKGYAHGINICLRKAISDGYEKFIVINNDIRLDRSFLKNARKSFYKNKESIIGGKIYYEKGYEYHIKRYRDYELGKVIWYAGGKIDWANLITNHVGVNEVDKGQFDKEVKTDFITGCCMLFDKNVIDRIGFMDEGYFMYFEDTDYCVRAKKQNINIVYDPSIILWHQNAQSTGGSGSDFHIRSQKKSRLRFGMKYAPIRTKIHLLLLTLRGYL